MKLLSFKNFSFSYSSDSPHVLSDISLELDERETIVVSGMSGAGKTTLCLAAAGLLKSFPASVSSGEIIRQRNNDTKRNGTAVVMQNFYAQITYLRSTVFEEIAFPCENMGLTRREIISRVEESLSTVRIEPLAFRNPLELSGGEKQKVVLATALAMKPALLILDGPLSQLDPETTTYLSDVLFHLKQEMALIIAENDPYLTLKAADRVIVLTDGRLIADGKLQDILSPITERELDLPAWTECLKSATEKGLLRGEKESEYELSYTRAIRKLTEPE